MKKLALLALAGAVVLTSCDEQKKEEEVAIQLPNVRVANVETGTFDHWVELQGNIESPQDVFLTPQTGGIIKAIRVQEGELVKKGQVIAVMDD